LFGINISKVVNYSVKAVSYHRNLSKSGSHRQGWVSLKTLPLSRLLIHSCLCDRTSLSTFLETEIYKCFPFLLLLCRSILYVCTYVCVHTYIRIQVYPHMCTHKHVCVDPSKIGFKITQVNPEYTD
jgi:hypothetical protein